MATSRHRTHKQVIEESVRQKASHLTDLAAKHGLSTTDVDECILATLAEPKKWSPCRTYISRVLGKLLRGAILLAAILICAYVLISCHKPTKQYIGRLAFNSSYPILRAIRLLSLPLARRIDMSSLYYSECAIPNPFFRGDASLLCYPCQNMDHVPVLKETKYQDFGQPFTTKDPSVKQFTFGEMKSWYLSNQKIFGMARDDHVESSNPFILGASDLFTEERKAGDVEQSPFTMEWRVASSGSIRLVRNLCGKPSFIPPRSEILPEMFVIIESSSSHAQSMPRPSFPGYHWVSQAHGSREIVLSPVDHCKNNCSEVSVILEAGGVLFFNSMYWQLLSFPFGDSISIVCIGSFSLE